MPPKKKVIDLDSVVEDIVVSVTAKVDTDKLHPERKENGVVDRSDSLDLVVRSVLDGMLGESANWVRPDISREIEELERVASEEGVSKEELEKASLNGKLEQLSDAEWKSLENTDSWATTSRSDGRSQSTKYDRDIEKIFAGMKHGQPIPAPIIFTRDDGSSTLVAGNTRLMAARALRQRPMILRIRLRSGMTEADEVPKELSRGMAHIDDLKPEEFLKFLEKYRDLPLKGGLEISEKVDGSAQMSFGGSGGKVWTKSKHGTVKTDPSQYPDGQMYQAVKRAHMALSPLGGSIPEGMTFISDVLWTRIPNSIEYGDNRIIVHGVFSQGKQIPAEEQKRIVDELAAEVPLSDDEENWKLEFKRTLDPAEVMVDVKTEYESLAQIYDELKKLILDKLKAAGKGPYKEALAKFQAVQSAVKKKLVSQLRKQSSAYGPKGGDVEGLVFRDLDSGAMTKLVDKEYFTKLNQFLWHYRELLDKGAKVGDQWQHGVMQKFRNAIADNVLGSAIAKTPGFVSKLAQFDGYKYMNLGSPDEKVDFLLSQYIENQKLMSGDNFVASFGDQLKLVRSEFEKLRSEWDEKKTGDLGFDVRDDAGAVSKRVKMDKIIVGRTDGAFAGMQDFLDGTAAALPKVAAMKNPLTQKVALMKLFLGQTKLEKLKDAIANRKVELSQKFEGFKKIRELAHDKKEDILSVVKTSADKLAAKGIKVGGELGTGANGTAFDIGGGKVLKVTTDVREAKSSFALAGKSLKRFCKIYEVFRFPEDKGCFGIVQEKLQPLSQVERDEIADCWGTLWDYFREINIPDLRQKAAEISKNNPPLQRQMTDCVNIYEKYGLKEIFDELESHGIHWEDLHPENLMRRGDTIVGLDLGVSDAPDGGAVPVLEAESGQADTRKSMFQAAPPADPEDDVDVRLANRKLDNTELVLNFAAKLKARGVVIPPNPHEVGHLGTGSKGTAIALQDGRVIKVTVDVEEAKAAFKLKGMKLKHIVKIDDVFQFPKSGFDKKVGPRYGIVQELLKPIPGATVKPQEATGEAKVLNRAFMTSFFDEGLTTAKLDWESVFTHMRKRLSKYVSEIGLEGSKKLQKDFYDALEVLKKYGIPGMVQELFEHGIKFQDYHAGNIMQRPSGDYVLIDLGYSKVEGGTAPPVLERMVAEGLLKLLGEARSDQVGVTIGRYQPFHKGHAEIIRELAKKFDKVLVIVAGNTVDKKNPFSFDTRLELMKRSLPDVISKVEIHKAQMDGKGSGYLPGVLSNIIRDKESALEADVAVQILVGEDRVAEYKKQMDHALAAKEKPGAPEMYFDPSLATVGALPGVKNDGDDDRISATRIREALAKDDRAAVEKMMDPHLVSNPADFEKLYVQMKKDLGVKPGIKVEGIVDEDLSDIGGDIGVDNILKTNAQALLNSRWKINVGTLKRLGSGMEGIAFDMGQGRVLKITADEGEAKTSFGLKSKTDLKYVVKIFDVFRFKNTAGINHPVFGLVTERLSPLSSTEAKEFDYVTEEAEVQMGKQHYLDVLYEGDWDKLVSEMRLAFEKDIAKESGLPAGNPRLARVLQARMDRYIPVYEKYKIPEMMKELRGAGIKFADYHSGNLMKRGAQYVINDIGRSKTTSAAEPPTLGEIVESIIGSIKESPFTGGFGSMQSGVQAGSSAWSSSKNRPDPNVPDLWQNQLTDLDTFHSGSADEK